MKKPIKIADIDKMALSRPEGYKEELLSLGEVKDDQLFIEWDDYLKMLDKYNPNARHIAAEKMAKATAKKPCCGQKMTGLGDMVAKVAQPIAKAIDAVAGTNVQGCGGCKKRQEYLNRVVPFSQG